MSIYIYIYTAPDIQGWMWPKWPKHPPRPPRLEPRNDKICDTKQMSEDFELMKVCLAALWLLEMSWILDILGRFSRRSDALVLLC